MTMFLVSFFSWWYGAGWKQVLESFEGRFSATMNLFSVTQLLRTLFAPWRRIISYPGRSLNERLRAWGDNLFSRVVGFIVRLFVLFAALLALITVSLFTTVELLIWPLLPLAIPGFLVIGLAV